MYVHVPWCRDRCTYCAFATVADDPAAHAPLIEAILREARTRPLRERAHTLYLGGGTPGLLPAPALASLLGGLRAAYPPESGAEITLEVNPSNVTSASLLLWADLGVTRLSIGVQTFRDDVLRRLGRHDDGARARTALDDVQRHWRGSWSADLLVGWNGQTDADLRADVDELLARSPPHVSVYGLVVEPGTPLAAWQQLGRTVTVPASTGERFDGIWSERLVEAGLLRYEASNFARDGHASRHNLGYWSNRDYVGLGPSAASSVHPLRWVNRSDPAEYVAALSRGHAVRQAAERVAPLSRWLESVALGLRTAGGLSVADADARFTPAWRELVEALAPDLLDDSRLQLDARALRAGPGGAGLVRADALAAELARRLSRVAPEDDDGRAAR